MKELQRMAHEDGIALTLYPWDKGQVSQSKLIKFYRGAGFKPTSKGAKNMAWSPMSETAQTGPAQIAAAFMADPIGKQYAKADCKTSTRAFVKWAMAKGFKPETMNLAPPSAETVKQRPELKGQSGHGDGHIFPIINGYGIDFTATQFPGVTQVPLITPVAQIPTVYKRIGGYYTDAPEWMGGKTSWQGPWDQIPADVMKDKNFADNYFKEDRTTAHDRLDAILENFADGKGPGRKGDSQRHGIPKGATIAQLEKAAKAPGRKGQLARWQLNMRRGKKKAHESAIDEVNIDNREGWGNVPLNSNVDYRGLRVMMRPSQFLSIAHELADPVSAKDIEQHLRSGGSIAAPFLDIKIPYEWEDGDYSQPAKIWGHEGRNRMLAVQKSEGDAPIEVHLFPNGEWRARDLTPEIIDQLQHNTVSQRGNLIRGPWFKR
jgi:hypothetical protein